MAKEDERSLGQKPKEKRTQMQEFDRHLAEAERIGRKLDVQLFAVCKEFAEWRDQYMTESGETHIDCRVATTTTDGKPRTLEVTMRYGQLVEEFAADDRFVGTTVFVNRWDQSNRHGSEAVAFIYPNDSYRGGFYQSWFFNEENEKIGSSVYGVLIREDARNRGDKKRVRYVAPGMKNLPHPIEKAREIVDMLKRGKVTHKLAYIGDKSVWQPV